MEVQGDPPGHPSPPGWWFHRRSHVKARKGSSKVCGEGCRRAGHGERSWRRSLARAAQCQAGVGLLPIFGRCRQTPLSPGRPALPRCAVFADATSPCCAGLPRAALAHPVTPSGCPQGSGMQGHGMGGCSGVSPRSSHGLLWDALGREQEGASPRGAFSSIFQFAPCPPDIGDSSGLAEASDF